MTILGEFGGDMGKFWQLWRQKVSKDKNKKKKKKKKNNNNSCHSMTWASPQVKNQAQFEHAAFMSLDYACHNL